MNREEIEKFVAEATNRDEIRIRRWKNTYTEVDWIGGYRTYCHLVTNHEITFRLFKNSSNPHLIKKTMTYAELQLLKPHCSHWNEAD